MRGLTLAEKYELVDCRALATRVKISDQYPDISIRRRM